MISKKITFIIIILFTLSISKSFSQDKYERWLQKSCEYQEVKWDYDYYYFAARGAWERFGIDRNYAYQKSDELRKKLGQIKAEKEALNYIPYVYLREKKYNFPVFYSIKECEKYKQTLLQEIDILVKEARSYEIFSNLGSPKYDYAGKSYLCPKFSAYQKANSLGDKMNKCDCKKLVSEGTPSQPKESNLEAEFLAEISKINADITVINRLARRKDIVESFGSAQILCDKLRRYQGDHYFSRTLKEIRTKNPGFSFSIMPLAEEVTREYWIRMRNRANHAYRNALEAHRGCVWNEGIQQAGVVEIPFAYAKLTFDLVNMWGDMCSKKLFGTLQKIHKAYQDPSKSLRPIMLISEDILAGGNDAYDWKTYAGIVGGAISGWDNFWKAWRMVEQYNVQGELIQANRQSAQQLIKSSKNLLQQFDRYRAFIDSHSSSIDCLRDKLMRIDLDNKSIKGDKITIWGTGLYDWTGDEFINIIKESKDDLENEYIYCEDFIKVLQITYSQAERDYHTIGDKARSSGAVQSQINDVLSQNEKNFIWFEGKVTNLIEEYTQLCEDEKNHYPDDVIIVSNQVVPGVEDQNVDPNDPPVWEYEDEEVYEPINEPEYNKPEQNNNNNTTTGGTSANGIISKGNGWSAQKIENNPAAIQNDITNAINSGKTPAGIYVSSGTEVVVYYIEGNPLGMTAWNLENYNDATSLQNGINSSVEQGYFPMGISFTDQGNLYVLYIQSQVQATAWQLVESQLDLGAVSTDLQPWINQQYVPVGITVYNGMYYTLMSQIPDTKISNWTIEGYQDNNNVIMQNVNAKINSGLLPFGYLKEGEVVNVLYVGF
ncbi:MAG: hypothetical protein K8R41_02575 [Bacteroidales bacterium]|nr:hypothetical protein [Bacteroidales bacterium]